MFCLTVQRDDFPLVKATIVSYSLFNHCISTFFRPPFSYLLQRVLYFTLLSENFANWSFIREIKFPRKMFFPFIREIKFPRKKTFSSFAKLNSSIFFRFCQSFSIFSYMITKNIGVTCKFSRVEWQKTRLKLSKVLFYFQKNGITTYKSIQYRILVV